MENGMQKMCEQSEQMRSQEQTAGALDSPAKTSVLQENSLDSQDIVAVCFSQLQNLLETRKKKIDPSTFSLRTLKAYLVLIEGLTLPSFSLSWMKSGTMRNGSYVIPRTMESPRTGKGCLLLDILDDEAEEKYFLSREQMEKIVLQ